MITPYEYNLSIVLFRINCFRLPNFRIFLPKCFAIFVSFQNIKVVLSTVWRLSVENQTNGARALPACTSRDLPGTFRCAGFFQNYLASFNPYWQISEAWAKPIFGKLIHSKLSFVQIRLKTFSFYQLPSFISGSKRHNY